MPVESLNRHLAATIAAAEAETRRRVRRIVAPAEPPNPTRVLVDGARCTAFCSNDYLGLSQDPRLVDASVRAVRHLGVGSGASHLISGHGPDHAELEEALADFLGRERAIVFSTGYMANLGIASALFARGDLVVEDRLNHASLIDAGLATGARFARFPHADVQAADSLLGRHAAHHRALLTDGVFSMDGDIAPLEALSRVCQHRDAWLVVDDAHGFGVLGANGAGTTELLGLSDDDVPVLMATFGKAMGTFGAFVAGSRDLIDVLVQRARTYVFTTALPASIARATTVALGIVREESWRRTHVALLSERLRAGAAALGLSMVPSPTPIQPLVLGGERRALEASEFLLRAGFLVPAIRPPTVPRGTSRLRITLSAAHSEDDVAGLLGALADWRSQMRPEPE